ncbi:unnamed protein product, partial [Iphiclides podalirius]
MRKLPWPRARYKRRGRCNLNEERSVVAQQNLPEASSVRADDKAACGLALLGPTAALSMPDAYYYPLLALTGPPAAACSRRLVAIDPLVNGSLPATLDGPLRATGIDTANYRNLLRRMHAALMAFSVRYKVHERPLAARAIFARDLRTESSASPRAKRNGFHKSGYAKMQPRILSGSL